MENESLNMLYSLFATGIIVPFVQWLKKYIPADFPIGTTMISALLSFGTVWLLAKGVAPTMPIPDMIQYALGLQFTNQVVHSVAKTPKKVKGDHSS